MGLTYATIELANMFDEDKFQDGLIEKSQVRRWSGQVLVDTGAIRLAINEEIRDQLGLRKGETITATMANGFAMPLELVGGIKVRFGNRSCEVDSFVLPGNTEPLLGAIPLEGMDLVVIPSSNTLEYNPEHPDGPVFSLK